MKGRSSKKQPKSKSKAVKKPIKKGAEKSKKKNVKPISKKKNVKSTRVKIKKIATSKASKSIKTKSEQPKIKTSKISKRKIKKPKEVTSKSISAKAIVQIAPHAVTSQKAEAKSNKYGMNDFQQCVVLAAIVNQHRNLDPKFLFIPLPDINSSALSPLREMLGNYHFTANDIAKAAKHIQRSNTFKDCFPSDEEMKEIDLKITKSTPKEIMIELFELAGPESKKTIYIADKNPHDIHKTTLEKYALKLGLIDPHPMFAENQIRQDHDFAHKQTLMKLNFQKMGRAFGGNSKRMFGNQRRGRG